MPPMQRTASCASHERRGRATIHSPPNILSARHTSRQTQRNGTGRNLGGVEANNTSHQIDHHRPRWTGLAPRSESRSKNLFRLYAAKALFIWNSYAAPFILTPNCIMGADHHGCGHGHEALSSGEYRKSVFSADLHRTASGSRCSNPACDLARIPDCLRQHRIELSLRVMDAERGLAREGRVGCGRSPRDGDDFGLSGRRPVVPLQAQAIQLCADRATGAIESGCDLPGRLTFVSFQIVGSQHEEQCGQ
jgi:hypothetical protein